MSHDIKGALTEDHVNFAYRLLFGRSPDPDVDLASAVDYYGDIDGLRRMMLHSEEFRDLSERLSLESSSLRWVCCPIFKRSFIYVSGSDLGVSRSILFHGRWEDHVLDIMNRYLKPGTTFLDVGANIGYFSLAAAELLRGSGGRVISIEANPEVLPFLYASIVQSQAADIIRVVPYAALDQMDSVSFMQDDSGNLGGSRLSDGSEKSTLIMGGALDMLLKDHSQTISFVKMDIEGSETRALAGMQNIILAHLPALLVEFNHSRLSCLHSSADELLGRVLDMGYFPVEFSTDGTERILSVDQVKDELSQVEYKDILFLPESKIL